MKKWLVIVLIPIMLIQSNMMLIIYTSFYYNQNYIEKYLCVQRSMQNNICHGQCYLMKKLKSQQEQEQQNFKVNFQESSLPEMLTCILYRALPLDAVDGKKYFRYHDLIAQQTLQSVFRPPVQG